VALTDGVVGPGQFDDAHRLDPAVASLAAKVRVVHDPDLDLRLPAERVARLRFAWRDGTTRTIEATNPVGDSDHGPLDDAALRSKVAGLIGDPAAERLADLTSELLEADDVRRVFGQIRQLAASTPSPDPERRSKRGIT
jgi:2-methylcitrate dehydratase PrpD